MMKSVLMKGGKIKLCGSCAQESGIFDLTLIDGVERSNMTDYANWVVDSEKVVNF